MTPAGLLEEWQSGAATPNPIPFHEQIMFRWRGAEHYDYVAVDSLTGDLTLSW